MNDFHSGMNIKADDPELTHSGAHYLLAVHHLNQEKGYARVTDVASYLDTTKGSVSTALSKLRKKELIEEVGGSKFLKLSRSGSKMVDEIVRTRQVFFHFFRDVLQIKGGEAMHSACAIEHLIPQEVTDSLMTYLESLNKDLS